MSKEKEKVVEMVQEIANETKTMDLSKREKYIRDFKKKAYKHVGLQFNVNTESDLIDYIMSLENKNDYIKALIRADMEKK